MNKSTLDKIVSRWDRLSARERHQLVQRFSAQITLLNEVLNALNDGVIIFDHDGSISFVNKAAARIYGREVREMVDIPFETLAGQTCTWEELSTSGNAITRDLQVHYPEPRHYRFFMAPLGSEVKEGESRQYLLLIQDETEKVAKSEIEAEAEQMSLLSFLASGVAHELGNPLNSLGLNLQLMQRKLNANGDKPPSAAQAQTIAQLLDSSLSEVKRLDTLIKQFLQSMRPSTPQAIKLDINKLIRKVLEVLEPEIAARGVSIHEELAEDIPLLDADEGQIFQVFYNLIRNAYQSIPEGTGGILIATSCNDADVIIQVSDTGCGISHEIMGNLYEPFRTTKESGNGLGLLIVRRIVKAHGGSLGLSSREGEGTTVSITLPRAERITRLLPVAE